MKQSDTMARFPVPFAAQADSSLVTFPIPQTKPSPGRVSLLNGFPVENFTPLDAGGSAPFGGDFNGLFRMLSEAIRANESGQIRPYSADYAQQIGGYPKAALVCDPSSPTGVYISLKDDNTDDLTQTASWVELTSDLASSLAAEQQARVAGELPVGSIVLWPAVNAPKGWVICDGRTFTPDQCPTLSQLFPSLKIPDLRGMFVRGLDTSGKIDPDQRDILSVQKDAMRQITGKLSGVAGLPYGPSGALQTANMANGSIQGGNGNASYFDLLLNTSQATPTAAENRPINTALHYIIRFA